MFPQTNMMYLDFIYYLISEVIRYITILLKFTSILVKYYLRKKGDISGITI